MYYSQNLNSVKFWFLVLLFHLSDSIRLDESGYYDLVVAIDDTTAQNSVDEYVDNIKYGIQDLSDLLHHTTNGTFSIRNANILVPIHWDVPGTQAATSEFFDGADIKISHRHYLPNVYNPSSCGNPGESISLPYNFFNEHDVGEYGRQGKALLTQFVRLRYGAWEEHGYPGDSRFPYYWRPVEDKEWQVNTCTDVPVLGTYQDVSNGSECGIDPEDVDQLYPPPSTCRFIPNNAQAVKSSIMSYHYLPTVEEFCTSKNHNKKTPSPQNFFCKYKSVMEVIENSPDWKQTTIENKDSKVEFKVVKNAGSPLFYILLDGGKSQAPASVLTSISTSLKTLVGDKELRNVVAAVGTFPGTGYKSYDTLVPWSYLRSNSTQVMNSFDTAFGSSIGFRNYPEALKTIADEIKSMKHEEGAAILIIKTGEEPNSGLTPENEVTASILNANIKIFAVEIKGNSLHPSLALQTITEKSDGVHLSIASPNDVKTPLIEFMTKLSDTLKTEIHTTLNYNVITKEVLPPGGKISIPTYDNKIINWKLYLVPLTGEISEPAVMDLGSETEIRMMERIDWGQSEQGSKKTYFYESDWPSDVPIELDNFSYLCDATTCEVLVIILAAFENPLITPDDNFHMSISTSAVNGEVDMNFANAATDLGVPFAIYARLDNDRIPIRGDENLIVTATIYHSDYKGVWTIQLKDDGTAVPDASTNDGIFSGTFVPFVNGVHKIFVSASYVKPPPPTTSPETTATPTTSNFRSKSVVKLLPVDQQHMGCGSGYLGCWSEPPEKDFKITQDFYGGIDFKNVDNYKNHRFVWRITDLEVIPMEDFTIKLKWTDPGYNMNSATGPVILPLDWYHIVHDESFDRVLNDFTNIEVIDTQYLQPRNPGTPREETYRIGRGGTRYFAIRTRINGQDDNTIGKVIPLVVGVNITEVLGSSTTTTTTTTTTRPMTTSTTRRTTVITQSTIEPEETTTILNTRTTPARSTTPRPTTVMPTTVRKTTETVVQTTEQDVKHWFEEKEGIITLSVFGGAILLLLTGGIIYFWFTRR